MNGIYLVTAGLAGATAGGIGIQVLTRKVSRGLAHPKTVMKKAMACAALMLASVGVMIGGTGQMDREAGRKPSLTLPMRLFLPALLP